MAFASVAALTTWRLRHVKGENKLISCALWSAPGAARLRKLLGRALKTVSYTHLDVYKRQEEGGAAFVHVDVMDGHFVPNLTLGVPFVAGLKKITKLPLDVHLMISNPLEQLPWYLEHTPDIVTVHAEALNADAGQFDLAIDMIHDAGCKRCV